MQFEVLGPLRVADGDREVFLRGRKTPVLLGLLLAKADQVVGTGEIVSEMWDGRPSERAVPTLHVYVSQLRKILAGPGRKDGGIVTRPPGYQLRLGPDDFLDLVVFSRLVEDGRRFARAGRDDKASTYFAQALDLWRGCVLHGLPKSRALSSIALGLEELRLECLELLVESELRLSRHREMVSSLFSLTVEHPFREAFHRQLMLALYRSERRADALLAYQSVRARLTTELGLEPGRPLRELHQAILLDDVRLSA